MAEPRKPRSVITQRDVDGDRVKTGFTDRWVWVQVGGSGDAHVAHVTLPDARRLHDALGRWIKWREYRDGK